MAFSGVDAFVGFAAVFGAALACQQELSQKNQDVCKCMLLGGYSPKPVDILYMHDIPESAYDILWP